MNLKKVLEAERQCKEFLSRAKAVREEASDDKFCFNGCKETASLRRQSHELSNSLISLREPL